MKLYLIWQNERRGYDTYDSAVVLANNEDEARMMDPSTGQPMAEWGYKFGSWATRPECVRADYLGEAEFIANPRVICASFNAG